jgi:aspartate dehydrogenase
MKVGILGCGAIANIITNFAIEGKLGVEIAFFYDRDMERAENLASQLDGRVVLNLTDMLDSVDLVVEAASPQAVAEMVPIILKRGKDVMLMSVGALIDTDLRETLISTANDNGAKIYIPSGAIAGLDGIKAASIGKIYEATLVTRKPPRSLGIETKEKKILFKGKASTAIEKFPLNINVAAALSLAAGKEIEVEIIADPEVDRNIHEVEVKGDFGGIRTVIENVPCSINPKTSVLAAYSAVKLLNSINENLLVGT